MSKADFDTDLQRQIEQINKHQMPKRDLWSGIELALSSEAVGSEPHRQASFGAKWWLASAAAVLCVGLLSWQMTIQQQPSAGEDLVAMLSEQHFEQKQALLVSLQDVPALTENWQLQLSELDEAAQAIKSALQQEPDNMALLRMLQSIHQQQIDLIERVHSPKWQRI